MNYLDPVLNGVEVEVSTGYDDAATSVVLASGEGAKLPDPSTDGNFNLVWYNATDYRRPFDDANVEIIRVTGKSTDTLTIVRPASGNSYNGEGSSNTAKAHNISGKTYKMILGWTKSQVDKIDNQLDSVRVLTSDFTTQSTTSVNVTGLSVALEANKKYEVKVIGIGKVSDGSATMRISLSIPASSLISGNSIYETSGVEMNFLSRVSSFGADNMFSTNATSYDTFMGNYLIETGATAQSVSVTAFITDGSYIATVGAGTYIIVKQLQ